MNQQLLPAAACEPVIFSVDSEGFKYEPIEPALDRIRRDGRRLIVLAATRMAAEDFAEKHELPKRRIIYGTPLSVRGLTNPDVVILPGWHEYRHATRTWAKLLPCFVTQLRKEPAR
jgi:hypothetical protein